MLTDAKIRIRLITRIQEFGVYLLVSIAVVTFVFLKFANDYFTVQIAGALVFAVAVTVYSTTPRLGESIDKLSLRQQSVTTTLRSIVMIFHFMERSLTLIAFLIGLMLGISVIFQSLLSFCLVFALSRGAVLIWYKYRISST